MALHTAFHCIMTGLYKVLWMPCDSVRVLQSSQRFEGFYGGCIMVDDKLRPRVPGSGFGFKAQTQG